MNTKLTLQLDESVILAAKRVARRRGKSVSKMVADYVVKLAAPSAPTHTEELPPITKSLAGLLAHSGVTKDTYHQHLRKKYQ